MSSGWLHVAYFDTFVLMHLPKPVMLAGVGGKPAILPDAACGGFAAVTPALTKGYVNVLPGWGQLAHNLLISIGCTDGFGLDI